MSADLGSQETLLAFTNQASAACWTFFALATLTFSLRTVSRIWFIDGSMFWEDLLITISWLLDVVRMVTLAVAISYIRQVTPENLMQTVPKATFWDLFTDSWAFLSITLPKIAVALLLIRLFRPRKWIKNTLLGASIGLFIICVVGFIICFVQCNPVAGQWDPYTHPDVVCWPRDVQIIYALFGSSSSTALDVLFAVYPAVVIMQLKMSAGKKITSIILMGLGLGAFATGVVKVSKNATLLGNPALFELYTQTMEIGLWNSIENDFIMIAACVPLVPAIFKRFRRDTSNGYSGRASKLRFTPLRSDAKHAGSIEEQSLELASYGQEPSRSDRAIHVKHDISIRSEPKNEGNFAVVSPLTSGRQGIRSTAVSTGDQLEQGKKLPGIAYTTE